jgi:hypothetical protein
MKIQSKTASTIAEKILEMKGNTLPIEDCFIPLPPLASGTGIPPVDNRDETGQRNHQNPE